MLELNISAQPIAGDTANDPENASIVTFEMNAGEICLTTMTNKLDTDPTPKKGPYTSAYVIAQWMAHKWWRLRHEDKPDADLKETDLEWWEAHNIIAADAAYVLPNCTSGETTTTSESCRNVTTQIPTSSTTGPTTDSRSTSP